MTLMQVKNVLFDYFCKNNLYVEGTSIGEHSWFAEYDERFLNVLINKGLDALEKDGLITKIESGKKVRWILNQPLESYKQNVELSGDVVNFIGNVLNKCSEKFSSNKSFVDKLNISSNDIIDGFSILEQLIISQEPSNN